VIYLHDILFALTGQKVAPQAVSISGAVIDSRLAEKGSLFIALPGENTDGHDFVKAAFANGATLAFVDREMPEDLRVLDLRPGKFDTNAALPETPFCLRVADSLLALQTLAAYWRGQHSLRVIGITGSVGKTSTKELTAALLGLKYNLLKNPGNRNNEIGLPLTLLDLEPQHEVAVLEMGFYVPGEIKTLCKIAQPQVGVVNNIGTVHAERAGSQETIAAGKAELVEALPAAPDGVAILNWDDPWVRPMAEKTKAGVLFYGCTNEADLWASEIRSHGLDGISCTLTWQGESHPVRSPLLGEFSVYTILRAVAVALSEGLDWETITQGLKVSQNALRMKQITLPNGVTVIDDTYNAAPESTVAALELLAQLPGRRVAILGDMLELGPYEQSGHESVGQAAAKAADALILVGERSQVTARAAIKAGLPESKVTWYPDAQSAAVPAAEYIQPGDSVLIKGSNSMRMNKIMAALKGEA
jgi:UDP-N-acetylmuramoyl-tripeptide--D-alanyl-D-alanine ligase